MSRTLHPALKAGAATALALALTSTAVLPATAMPVVPEAPAAPTTPADPAVQSGQAASEVRGEEEQSIAIGGIDPEALPEPAQVESTPSEPSEPTAPAASSATTAPSAEATPQADADERSTGFALTSLTGPAASAAPAATAAPTASTSAPAPTPQGGEAEPKNAGQPSDVVLRKLQDKAEASTATIDAPAAAEAPELAPTVLEEAAADDGVDAADIAALTQPIETIDFIVAGVTWDIADAGHVTDVSLRVREDSAWTDWSSMEIHDGDEKPGAERVGTEPLVSSGADAIQMRIETVDGEVPAGLELDLIDPGTAETDGKLEPASAASPALAQTTQQNGVDSGEPATAEQAFVPSTAPSTSTSTAAFVPAIQDQQGLITGTAQAATTATNTNADALLKPAIITRAQWGANESLVQDYGTPAKDLKAMYVHHTAGSNNYTAAGAYAQIRGIFTYHAKTLAWGDIGYQFLVDKYGNIFQGRRGSIDKPVQGAQAGGFNTDTIGVSAMGNYDVAAAPAGMVNAIEKVLAWQAYRYGVNPTGSTTLTQRGNAASARWSDGKRVSVPTILGHKVTNTTACPGRYLDAKLPSIRKDVAALVNAAESRDNAVTPTPTPAVKRPGLPSNPYKLAAPGSTTTLDWNPVSGVDHYQVMYRSVPHGGGNVADQKWLAGRTTKSTSLVVSAEPGETAQFAVRAVRNGVPGPQAYVGQHTAPVSWDHPSVHFAAMNRINDSYGVGGQGIRTTGRGAAVRIENAGAADRVVVTAKVSSGTANFEVTRDGKYVGLMRIAAGGLTVCGLDLPAGSNVRLELTNTATTTLTNIALTRPGHTQDLFLHPTRCQASFTDVVAGDNYFKAVDWMLKEGITTGYANRTFGIRRNISRGESLAFIHRYVDPKHTPQSGTPFRDVPRNHTFFLPISWAESKGIAKGYSNGRFGIGRNVTRGEFASFLYRAAKPKYSVPKSKSFKDVAAGSTHHAAISWMKSTGLSKGYANGQYNPTRPITRGEVALILHRFDQR
jgi:uncharacterized protein with LGFP repeats